VSEEKVEIAKRAIDAFNQRNSDVYGELFTPDFEWFPAMILALGGESVRGPEGVEAAGDAIPDAWEEFRVVGEELRDLGDRVLVLGRQEGRGRGSGLSVDAPFGAIFDFRDGRISRIRSFLNHSEALRGAGLTE
jgi:ketosteroid isomerase-like protein